MTSYLDAILCYAEEGVKCVHQLKEETRSLTTFQDLPYEKKKNNNMVQR